MSYENIGVEQFLELMSEENHVILDVRSPQELPEGVIPGMQMIDFFAPTFRDEVARLDKAKSYLVYCRSGNRSSKACSIMSDLGFEHLYNLVGGIGAWNDKQMVK